MKRLMPILILFLLVVACEPKNSRPDFDGTYSGAYTRDDSVTTIYLTIENGRFEGSSESSHFPAICRGTVGWDDNTIEFDDECIWTADFDWTLILSGRYNYAYASEKLTFWRGVGEFSERYTIEKLKTK